MGFLGYEVFISFKRNALDGSGKTRDYEIASDLHKALKDAGVEAFMSEKDLFTYDFRRKIDDALDESKILIAVGTSRDNMESENVRYEWTSFHNDILSRIKPDAQIFSFIEGMNHNDLPRALRHYESLTTDEKNRLVEIVMKNLGMTTPKPEPIIEPVPIFHPIPKTQPAQQMQPTNPTLSSAPRLNVSVGNRIPFGQYPQGANGEIQPLMWRVLAVENGRALMITDKLIDAIRYNEEKDNVTWETCTLRKWMNNNFISKAFNISQQAQIATVTNQNPNSPVNRTKGGNATQDKFFALSRDEAKKYFCDDDDRKASPTSYAIKNGALTGSFSLSNGETTGIWWLRTPGVDSTFALGVLEDGSIGQYGNGVDHNKVAVRPAFWMKLS